MVGWSPVRIVLDGWELLDEGALTHPALRKKDSSPPILHKKYLCCLARGKIGGAHRGITRSISSYFRLQQDEPSADWRRVAGR